MTVDELRNFLNEHPIRGDYKVVLYDSTADITTQLFPEDLVWKVANKRFIIYYD